MPAALLLAHPQYNLHSVLNNFNVKTCLERDERMLGGIGALFISNAQTRQKPSKKVKQQPAKAGNKQRHFWKRTDQFATGTKARTLLEIVVPLSNVKEEIYAALDEFLAFETEFPIVAVGKALQSLRKEDQWQRIIQVSKWMLSKGQGQTMGTYDLLLNAYDMDARLEDAEALWEKLLAVHTRSVPKKMFVRMMSIYKRREMPEKLLEVFNQMEDLGIKPDEGTLKRIIDVYKQLGMPEKEEELTNKYSSTWNYYHFKGKNIRVPARQPNKYFRPDDIPGSADMSEE